MPPANLYFIVLKRAEKLFLPRLFRHVGGKGAEEDDRMSRVDKNTNILYIY